MTPFGFTPAENSDDPEKDENSASQENPDFAALFCISPIADAISIGRSTARRI
ncbi:MAG: hypothetical protein WDO06_00255 [Actinomycetota bacterium]